MSKKGLKKSEAADDTDDYDRIESMFTRLLDIVTKSFNQTLDRVVDAIESKLTTRLEAQSAEIFNMAQSLEKINKRLDEVLKENNSMKGSLVIVNDSLAKIQKDNDNIEQYTRSDNILIHGIPFIDNNAEKNLDKTVLDVINSNMTSVNILPSDISILHRVSRPSSAPSSKPQPVVVKFTRKTVRNDVLHHRKELKGKRISITEQLTPFRSQMLMKANDLVRSGRLMAAWSQDGRILVKAPDNLIRQIASNRDLDPFTV